MRSSRLVASIAFAAAVTTSAISSRAASVTFATGSLIIPMDVDYQDAGMLKAFGLLDKLLRAGVPVQWVIKTPKAVVDAAKGKFEDDFTASATDFKTPSTVISAHGYRGGPFVIKAADAAAAKTVITAWQSANTTAVHVTTAPFTANVSRTLTASPRIAVLGDGNQGIAFNYLNAAGILDEDGKVWSGTSTDLLIETAVMGPTSTNHKDGALFRPSGEPAFCEIMTMHWGVTDTAVPEVTAEMAHFLEYPVHVNAECQAVNAVEGAPPTGGRSNFVTTQGFQWPAPAKPTSVDFLNSALPFAQMDGPFGTVGGSEPAYALGPGSAYYDTGIVMVKGAGSTLGTQDVWMTGYANTGKGTCPITSELGCVVDGHSLGKVSYLGGHQYDVKVPISTNPTTQGTRLFLNSLFEAGCVTAEGQPKLAFAKSGPAVTSGDTVTYTVAWTNTGAGPALSVVLTDPIPTGSSFVSATGGGTFAAGVVTWTLGDLSKDAAGSVDVTVKLGSFGTYANTAGASYKVGLNTWTATSNTVTTTYVDCAADSGACVCGGCDAGTDGGSDATFGDTDVDSTIGGADSSATDSSSGSVDSGAAVDSSIVDSTTVVDSALGDTTVAVDTMTADTGTTAFETSTSDSAADDTASAADSIASDDTMVAADGGPTGDVGSGDSGTTTDDSGSTADDSGSTTDDSGSTADDSGSTTDDGGGTDETGVGPAADTGTDASGGCGCHTTTRNERDVTPLLALAALAVVIRRRTARK
ncbi:MAG: hypothetical protein ACXVEE_12175 [Polyangiales bacterium]